jgi:anti-sigma-K factor RskA
MNCDKFKDRYEAYALGILEGPEFEELRAHLESGCPTCSKALAEIAEILPLLRYTVPQREPPTGVEARLREVLPIRPAPITVGQLQPTSWTSRYVWLATASAMLLSVTAVIGWHAWWTQRKETAQVEDENRQLRRERQELLAQPAQPPLQGPPALSKSQIRALKQQLLALQKALETANKIASDARRALSEEDGKIRELQNALDQKERASRAVQLQWSEKERAYRAAVSERETALRDKDETLAAYVNDIRRLTQQLDQYKTIVGSDRDQLKGRERLVALLSSPSLKFVTLRGTEKAGKAAGHAFVSLEAGIVFYGFNLPALPRDRTYQLWLIRGRAPAIVSGGLFTPDAHGTGWISFNETVLIPDITALAVTDEPLGGSPLPTGHKFLIGTSS